MTSRDDVYRQFGYTAEAAQLLETELGNLLLEVRENAEGLMESPSPERASEILASINASPLGRLVRSTKDSDAVPDLQEKLGNALEERNRLIHRFFRQHNFRISSDEGRSIMYRDLEAIHGVIFDAYKSLIEATHGIDLDEADPPTSPTGHLPI